MDSGRGPSEEDPEALRSSSGHNHSASFNDSRESAESNRSHRNGNYLDMNRARKHQKSNSTTYSPSIASFSTNQRLARLNSDASYQSEAPSIPPRGAKPPVHPRTAIIYPQHSNNRQKQSHFPDINVPNVQSNINNMTSSSKQPISHYHTHSAPVAHAQRDASHAHSNRCVKHNVVDHFPELCERQKADTPPWGSGREYPETDGHSDGGSTTSGSYMVDNSQDHLDLGAPEISRDVFV